MEENIIFEQEGEMPENWVSDTIFVRDDKGDIVEIEVPDDEEG